MSVDNQTEQRFKLDEDTAAATSIGGGAMSQEPVVSTSAQTKIVRRGKKTLKEFLKEALGL